MTAQRLLLDAAKVVAPRLHEQTHRRIVYFNEETFRRRLAEVNPEIRARCLVPSHLAIPAARRGRQGGMKLLSDGPIRQHARIYSVSLHARSRRPDAN